MLIHCMQHGVSMSKELHAEEPLSPVGRDMVEKSAAAIRALGLSFDLMLASPKARSKQTCALVARAVGHAEQAIQVTDLVKAMADPGETIEFLRGFRDANSVFIAGHLPHLNRLACRLLHAGKELELGIENGGLFCMEGGLGARPGRLVYLMPRDVLHALA